ncbi:MAG TPA: glycosyltransferase family 1 protein [Chromatiaceae bacterium]|nr:glycosyltransferase family 1 protein [Chromatiaceae bacterium]
MNDGDMNILITHPRLFSGGSEARALWAAQALKNEHKVTLMTGEGADLERLNMIYGTELSTDDIEVIEGGLPRWLKNLHVGDALRGAFFHRWLGRNVKGYDLVLSTYNLVDVPVPTLQFIADFSWDDGLRQKYHQQAGFRGVFHRQSLMRKLYLWLVKKISGASAMRAMALPNKVIANSWWSADLLRKRYGIECGVVYPPVVQSAIHREADERISRFVTIGRISPEKELEKLIDIIARVREFGHDVSLHIVGSMDASDYCLQLLHYGKRAGKWVVFEGAKYGEEKEAFLHQSRYGIHGCVGEAFGIAVAEMLQAGCITFAPTEGGPAEIVGDKRLLYLNEDDAVEKICRVLSDESQQKDLYRQLKHRTEKYSAKQFSKQIRRLVEEWRDG